MGVEERQSGHILDYPSWISSHVVKVTSGKESSNNFVEHHKGPLTSYIIFIHIKKTYYI